MRNKKMILVFMLLGVLSCVFTYVIHCSAHELCIDHLIRYFFLGGVLGTVVGMLVTLADGLSMDDDWERNV